MGVGLFQVLKDVFYGHEILVRRDCKCMLGVEEVIWKQVERK